MSGDDGFSQVSSANEDCAENPVCRICFEGAENGHFLDNLCACKGSQRWVHHACLVQWLRTDRATDRCPTCAAPLRNLPWSCRLGVIEDCYLRWRSLGGILLACSIEFALLGSHWGPQTLILLTDVWLAMLCLFITNCLWALQCPATALMPLVGAVAALGHCASVGAAVSQVPWSLHYAQLLRSEDSALWGEPQR